MPLQSFIALLREAAHDDRGRITELMQAFLLGNAKREDRLAILDTWRQEE